jgi:hypothetical protein
LVSEVWSFQWKIGNNNLDCWQEKVRYFRKLAKGWSADLEAKIRKHKKVLMKEYDALDILSET